MRTTKPDRTREAGIHVPGRSRIVLALALGLLLVLVLAGRSGIARGSETRIDPVQRGHYLVTIAGCNDCHTPFVVGEHGPEPDMSRQLSGHPESLKMPPPPAMGDSPWIWVGAGTNTAFAGPWGISYAPNLTPEQNTGLGAWTEDIFFKAMRTGRHWGASRPILPPMPWQSIATMTDEDLGAIYAYLQSIPPIVNRVPDSEPVQP
jgi:Cytochrome c